MKGWPARLGKTPRQTGVSAKTKDNSAAMDDQQASLEYFSEQQCASQWRGFLSALAGEFTEQLPAEDLRALWRRIGERFAAATPLGDCQTLDDLEAAINRIWAQLNWGWVRIDDQGDALAIRHHCAPLRAAFGAQALPWSAGYLEGAYQSWFSSLGIDPGLHIRQAPEVLDALEFRLAR